MVKNLLSVVKVQNGGCIQDGVENVNFFYSILSKIIFFVNFYFFLFTLGKNKTYRKFFLLKIQNGGIIKYESR
jgi:hypothetical protein